MTNAPTVDQLQHELARAQLLNRVLFATSAVLDTRHVLQRICEELSTGLAVPQAGIALLNPARDALTVTAYTSTRGNSAIGAVIPVHGNPSSEHVIGRGEPLYIADAQHDPRMVNVHELMRAQQVVSILLIPIWSAGAVVGTLGLDTYEPRSYSAEEIALVEQVAAAVSSALENARLYEAAQAELERRREAEEIIRAQAAALNEVSTPLLAIAANVVLMPLIGLVDNDRAQQVIAMLLQGIQEHRARIAIMDITGVGIVDTHTAAVLVRAAQAAKLLGARVMLTGIRPEVAQTLVGLGVDLSDLVTTGSLQQGIALALKA